VGSAVIPGGLPSLFTTLLLVSTTLFADAWFHLRSLPCLYELLPGLVITPPIYGRGTGSAAAVVPRFCCLRHTNTPPLPRFRFLMLHPHLSPYGSSSITLSYRFVAHQCWPTPATALRCMLALLLPCRHCTRLDADAAVSPCRTVTWCRFASARVLWFCRLLVPRVRLCANTGRYAGHLPSASWVLVPHLLGSTPGTTCRTLVCTPRFGFTTLPHRSVILLGPPTWRIPCSCLGSFHTVAAGFFCVRSCPFCTTTAPRLFCCRATAFVLPAAHLRHRRTLVPAAACRTPLRTTHTPSFLARLWFHYVPWCCSLRVRYGRVCCSQAGFCDTAAASRKRAPHCACMPAACCTRSQLPLRRCCSFCATCHHAPYSATALLVVRAPLLAALRHANVVSGSFSCSVYPTCALLCTTFCGSLVAGLVAFPVYFTKPRSALIAVTVAATHRACAVLLRGRSTTHVHAGLHVVPAPHYDLRTRVDSYCADGDSVFPAGRLAAGWMVGSLTDMLHWDGCLPC